MNANQQTTTESEDKYKKSRYRIKEKQRASRLKINISTGNGSVIAGAQSAYTSIQTATIIQTSTQEQLARKEVFVWCF